MKTDPTRTESAFIGKLTAGATHELNNILAIIRESAGLIQDLMTLNSTEHPDLQETVQRCLDTVEQQIVKGTVLLKDLNRLAHSPDRCLSRIDTGECLEQLLRLYKRSAAGKQVRLSLCGDETRPLLTTHPVVFQMAVFTALQICLDTFNSPGEISFRIAADQDSAIIDLKTIHDSINDTPDMPPAENTPLWNNLSLLIKRLSGRFERLEEEPLIRLIIPSLTSASHPE